MSTKVTLGGDRLGAGNKMKVAMHGYERSTHNLGYVFRTTMAPGTLVPFICEPVLPGDTWDIDLDAIVKTLPTVGPLFGSYKAQFDIHLADLRLYNALMHNNTLGVGRKISDIKLPQINLTATQTYALTGLTVEDINTSQINPSCILAYIGIRGVGSWIGTGGAPIRNFNFTAGLAYWDIVKNYYTNKQEGSAYVLHTPVPLISETVTTLGLQLVPSLTVFPVPEVPDSTNIALNAAEWDWRLTWTGLRPNNDTIIIVTNKGNFLLSELIDGDITPMVGDEWRANFNYSRYPGIIIYSWRYITASDIRNIKPEVIGFPIENLDTVRQAILQHVGTTPWVINDADLVPFKYLYEQPNGIPNALASQEGLAVKTYNSDVFNNWLDKEWISGTNGVNEVTAIDTSSGSFTIDTFIINKKVFNMLNRIVVSDGSLDSWQEVVYDHKRKSAPEAPVYQGGMIKEVIFQEVVSNSETAGQPLGTLAGRGTFAGKHKGGNVIVKPNEHGYIMGIVSLTPRIDYSQGNRWDTHLNTLDDFHKPALDEIGFQESMVEERAWWDTNWSNPDGAWIQNSAGKVPAWLNYMTNHNRTFGDFAIENNSMFMTLNRRYEAFYDDGPERVAVLDLTTYIDPSKYNFIFAQTALDAQNFWMQIAVDMTVRRKMSYKIMPNL